MLNGKGAAHELHICELQKICAVDWHQPDRSASILRGFIEQIRNDEDKFIAEFVDAVETVDLKDDKMTVIRRMGQFALAAQRIDMNDSGEIVRVLLEARQQWDNFEEIESAYRKFRGIKIKEMERSVEAFVGTPGSIRDDNRYPRTKADFKLVKGLFVDYFDKDSKKKRRVTEAAMRGRQIPDIDKIVSEGEAEPTYELALLKRVVNNGYELQPFDLAKLMKGFSTAPRMLEELQRVIDSLVIDPRGLGTKSLTDRTIRIGGKTFPLMEFKPGEKPRLKVSNQRYRITYAIPDSHVAILKIIRRDKLNKDH